MYKPLSLFIGLRYTRARRRNHFISFISLTSILGLMLGVGVMITVLSVMNGFDHELRTRILGMVPQATINAYQPIEDWPSLARLASKNPQVEASAPFIQMQGMLTAQGNVTGAVVTGVLPDAERKVSIVDTAMTQGHLANLQSDQFGIVLGAGLASSLGVGPGDKVMLVLPEASLSPAGVIPRFKRFTVVGVFKVGAEVDSSLAYIHLDDAARMLRMQGQVQGLRLKLKDLFQAPEVTRQILGHLSENFYGSTWEESQGNLFSAIQMEKTMMGLLLFLIVAVAAFNIVSSLVMVVTDKKADIAILRTLGASPETVQRIFMVQGSFIGLVGTGMGVVLGVTLALTISGIINGIQKIFGLNLFAAYFVD
ncbi:MAG: lipoprotein-releasing ABC transporter permease subunit, partial [Pseudomonadales bacterium]|nr:lipoprotein-releasing ABC transporter permease subunit [Pseudomonadales bacterium]